MASKDDTYAALLRETLEREGWSQLRLVRELAALTGNAVESERSAVRGYLAGATPRPERAALIAKLLGEPRLAKIENPRRSAAARLERHLEELAANDDAILANQEAALTTQLGMLDELRAIREALDTLLGDAHTRSTPNRGESPG